MKIDRSSLFYGNLFPVILAVSLALGGCSSQSEQKVASTSIPSPTSSSTSTPSPSPTSTPQPKESATPEPPTETVTPKPKTQALNQPASNSSGFNAQITDPPSNCRSGPGKDNSVVQELQKGDVLVDQQRSQSDSAGGSWYREEYLNCWIHASQLQFKTGQSVEAEPTPSPVANDQGGYIAGTCKQLKAQGLGPFYQSQNDPNYTAARDRDQDGIACD